MSKSRLQLTVSIDKTPDAVVGFIADIRNRSKYLTSLTAISDIQGEPGEIGGTWQWKWNLMDNEFAGTGRCVEHTPARRYAFVTEGGITSKFTYQAEPDGDGTNLTVDVEFEIPQALQQQADTDQLLAAAKLRGQESLERLKAMLEQ